MRPQQFLSCVLGLTHAFIPFPRIYLSDQRQNKAVKGESMYNNYLSCEVCKVELTRQSQKQKLDDSGYMHSYCQKCYSEKYPK